MTAGEGIDLSAPITERIDRDNLALKDIDEQIADLMLVREIIQSLQVARKKGVGSESTEITPTAWAEYVRLPLSTVDLPGHNRNINESKQRLALALGRVGAAHDIPEAQARLFHTDKNDFLFIDSKLF